MQSVEVVLGAHERNTNDFVWKRRFPRSAMKIHENYNAQFIMNDIALIEISGLKVVPGKINISVNKIPFS
jgi:hypothetical protein